MRHELLLITLACLTSQLPTWEMLSGFQSNFGALCPGKLHQSKPSALIPYRRAGTQIYTIPIASMVMFYTDRKHGNTLPSYEFGLGLGWKTESTDGEVGERCEHHGQCRHIKYCGIRTRQRLPILMHWSVDRYTPFPAHIGNQFTTSGRPRTLPRRLEHWQGVS